MPVLNQVTSLQTRSDRDAALIDEIVRLVSTKEIVATSRRAQQTLQRAVIVCSESIDLQAMRATAVRLVPEDQVPTMQDTIDETAVMPATVVSPPAGEAPDTIVDDDSPLNVLRTQGR